MNGYRHRIAFLGLGLMGAPMAKRLTEAGFDVTVWNRSADKCRAFEDGRTRIASTPAEAAKGASRVLLCLLDTRVVEEVTFGAKGIARSLDAGSCVIDFSTIDPQWVRSAHRRVREQYGAQWIDAPVSGGVPGARAGTLTMFCGGSEALLEDSKPILQALASRITHFGEVSCGIAAKLCNQALVATQLVAIAEALSLAAHAGLDPRRIPEALQGGWADSTLLKLFGPRFATRTEEPRLGQMITMLETLDLARKLGSSTSLSMPLADAAATVFRAAGEAGLLDRDLGALMGMYRDAPQADSLGAAGGRPGGR